MNENLRKIFLKHWPLGLLLIVIVIIGLPSLWVNWMIVDDGYYLLVEQKISFFLSHGNFSGLGQIINEQAGGRFRPMLWIYLWFTYLIGGTNPVIHHFLGFLISGLTVVLIYKIITVLTNHKFAGLIGGLFFTLSSFNLENWYRLKTPEPKITFFIAISIYFIVLNLKRIYDEKKENNKYLLFSILPLFFVYFIRETSFAFLSFSLFLMFGIFLFKRNDRRFQLWLRNIRPYFLINLILALIIFTVNYLLKQQGSYTANYQLVPFKMLGLGYLYFKIFAKEYGLLFWLLGFSSLISLFSLIKLKNISFLQFIQYSFLGGLVSFFIAILPWGLPLVRYLEMILLFLSLFFGVEVFNLFNHLPKKWVIKLFKTNKKLVITPKFLMYSLLSFGIIWIGLNNYSNMYNYIRNTIIGQKNINIILRDLSLKSQPNAIIYWNFKEKEEQSELIMQCNLLLNIVYSRPDLQIVYLNSKSLQNLHSGDLIMNAIVYDKDYYLSEEELLKKYRNMKVITSLFHEVKKISLEIPIIKRMDPIVLLGRPTVNKPIYSESFYQNIWKIYQIN